VCIIWKGKVSYGTGEYHLEGCVSSGERGGIIWRKRASSGGVCIVLRVSSGAGEYHLKGYVSSGTGGYHLEWEIWRWCISFNRGWYHLEQASIIWRGVYHMERASINWSGKVFSGEVCII
jgi:hypothetical protein